MPDNNPTPGQRPIVNEKQLEAIASRHGRSIGASLFVGAVTVGVIVALELVRLGPGGHSLAGWFGWVIGLGVILLVNATLWVTTNFGQLTPGEKLRFTLVSLGGMVGIGTAFFGLSLPFSTYSDVFAGGFAEWRKNPTALFWTGLPLFGGLTLAFVSLLLTAGLERTSAAARRLLYGYNAVLSGLLLLFIFLLLNVLPYSGVRGFRALAQTADWTSSGLYSLSQATKERLAGLKEPVKVYVLLSGADQIGNEVETLLQNAREITNKVSWETLSPEINRRQVSELVDKYQLTDPRGMLVLYGPEPNPKFEFIPRKDLFTDTSTEDTARFAFKGEPALVKALTYLAEGKKSVVYVTQGHGELDLNERSPERPDAGIGIAADRLGQANFEVKPLAFDPNKPKVPDDADVVIVARPTQELPADAVAALRAYAAGDAKKKGKLFVLLDVVPTRDAKWARSGLEPLLLEYGVRVADERLIAVRNRNPLEILTITNPRGGNPIARAFFPQGSLAAVPFRMTDARPVTVNPPIPGAPARYSGEPLLIAPPDQLIVQEAGLAVDPATLAADLRKDREKLVERITQNPPTVAVTVSEGKGAPPIPGHEFMQNRETQPRLVVFGDASWVSNREIAGRQGADNYDLFASCVNWLRERPDVGTQAVADKTRAEYRLPPDAGGVRLLVLPVAMILLAVLGLGLGVWVVRRR